jgi:PDZ domain-containing protein
MRRRAVTVLIGFVLVAGLTVLASRAPVPYVELQPGPTYDTLGKDDAGRDVIQVTGATATTSAGQLRFVTIGVLKDLSLTEALIGWWRSEDAVVPKELIYPPAQTEQQVEKQNADEFAASQSAAQTAAFKALGYPIQIKVKEVSAGAPAQGRLLPGDVITTVDGVTVNTADKLLGALRGKPAGTTFAIGVNRDGQAMTVQVPTLAGADGVPRIGVTHEITSTAPFKISIPIENIGGPSAGLMLTLGIIDKIKPEDLTGGKIIAGTGTIDADGNVGPIGGVPQKLVASKNAGATYFLTPKDNCAEAVANRQAGLPLVQVASLTDALTALADIRAGKQPQLCRGTS